MNGELSMALAIIIMFLTVTTVSAQDLALLNVGTGYDGEESGYGDVAREPDEPDATAPSFDGLFKKNIRTTDKLEADFSEGERPSGGLNVYTTECVYNRGGHWAGSVSLCQRTYSSLSLNFTYVPKNEGEQIALILTHGGQPEVSLARVTVNGRTVEDRMGPRGMEGFERRIVRITDYMTPGLNNVLITLNEDARKSYIIKHVKVTCSEKCIAR